MIDAQSRTFVVILSVLNQAMMNNKPRKQGFYERAFMKGHFLSFPFSFTFHTLQ